MKQPYFDPATLPRPLHAPMGFGDGDGDDSEADSDTDTDSDDDADDAPPTPTAEEIAETKALERQARAQGWRPKDEFAKSGKAGDWVDAATFLERGAKFNKSLQREIEQLKAARDRDAKLLQQFKTYHEEAMAKKDKDIDEAIRKTKLERQEAIRNGEDETALHLDDRLEALKEEKAALKKAPKDEEEPEKKPLQHEIEAENQRKAKAIAEGKEPLPPAMQEWLDEGNEWFRDNSRMRGYALAIGEEMRASGDRSMDREFLDKVTAQMHEDFPEFFKNKNKSTGNPLRQRAGAVESGAGKASSQEPGRTARDLPKEDRDLMKKFVKDGLMTEEAFLKNYRW